MSDTKLPAEKQADWLNTSPRSDAAKRIRYAAAASGPWQGEDYERHQVICFFGRNAPRQLAEMQKFCDEYGNVSDV